MALIARYTVSWSCKSRHILFLIIARLLRPSSKRIQGRIPVVESGGPYGRMGGMCRKGGVPPPARSAETQTLQGIQRPRKYSTIDSYGSMVNGIENATALGELTRVLHRYRGGFVNLRVARLYLHCGISHWVDI